MLELKTMTVIAASLTEAKSQVDENIWVLMKIVEQTDGFAFVWALRQN